MNANQMADILDTYTDTGMATSLANTNIKKVATMLRQQQAEIEVLKKENEELSALCVEFNVLRKAQESCNGFCGEYECKENKAGCKRKAQEK